MNGKRHTTDNKNGNHKKKIREHIFRSLFNLFAVTCDD